MQLKGLTARQFLDQYNFTMDDNYGEQSFSRNRSGRCKLQRKRRRKIAEFIGVPSSQLCLECKLAYEQYHRSRLDTIEET